MLSIRERVEFRQLSDRLRALEYELRAVDLERAGLQEGALATARLVSITTGGSGDSGGDTGGGSGAGRKLPFPE